MPAAARKEMHAARAAVSVQRQITETGSIEAPTPWARPCIVRNAPRARPANNAVRALRPLIFAEAFRTQKHQPLGFLDAIDAVETFLVITKKGGIEIGQAH